MKHAHRFTLGAIGLLAAILPFAATADNNGVYNMLVYSMATLKTANGEQVYTHICQGCHMPDGKGAQGAGRYPAFAGNPTLASAAYVATTVLYGRRDMPSFVIETHNDPDMFFMRMSLSDAQIADVVNYIRTHFGNHYTDTLTTADVQALHSQAH
jgi:mono/diheme cytochrome c family protein